jgi:hypothetical protein
LVGLPIQIGCDHIALAIQAGGGEESQVARELFLVVHPHHIPWPQHPPLHPPYALRGDEVHGLAVGGGVVLVPMEVIVAFLECRDGNDKEEREDGSVGLDSRNARDTDDDSNEKKIEIGRLLKLLIKNFGKKIPLIVTRSGDEVGKFL